jgi:hypothetical protein
VRDSLEYGRNRLVSNSNQERRNPAWSEHALCRTRLWQKSDRASDGADHCEGLFRLGWRPSMLQSSPQERRRTQYKFVAGYPQDLALTEARAMVVREYLVENVGFDGSQAKTLGLGKRRRAKSVGARCRFSFIQREPRFRRTNKHRRAPHPKRLQANRLSPARTLRQPRGSPVCGRLFDSNSGIIIVQWLIAYCPLMKACGADPRSVRRM